MKVFTEEEVSDLIKMSVSIVINCTVEFFENETDIVTKNTENIIEDSEITKRKNSKSLLNDYIIPKLSDKGIKMTVG